MTYVYFYNTNGVGSGSFLEAINNATDGCIIMPHQSLLDASSGPIQVTLKESDVTSQTYIRASNVTIDGGNRGLELTYQGSTTSLYGLRVSGKSVTFRHVSFITNGTCCPIQISTSDGGTIVFEACKFICTSSGNACFFRGRGATYAEDFTFRSCLFYATGSGRCVYWYTPGTIPCGSVFENCTLIYNTAIQTNTAAVYVDCIKMTNSEAQGTGWFIDAQNGDFHIVSDNNSVPRSTNMPKICYDLDGNMWSTVYSSSVQDVCGCYSNPSLNLRYTSGESVLYYVIGDDPSSYTCLSTTREGAPLSEEPQWTEHDMFFVYKNTTWAVNPSWDGTYIVGGGVEFSTTNINNPFILNGFSYLYINGGGTIESIEYFMPCAVNTNLLLNIEDVFHRQLQVDASPYKEVFMTEGRGVTTGRIRTWSHVWKTDYMSGSPYEYTNYNTRVYFRDGRQGTAAVVNAKFVSAALLDVKAEFQDSSGDDYYTVFVMDGDDNLIGLVSNERVFEQRFDLTHYGGGNGNIHLNIAGTSIQNISIGRTYYYIGSSASGSLSEASDWSLSVGGAPLTVPPVIKDSKFYILEN